ncbi:hypothetical protein [Bartonella bovis]|uniref:Right handed beta helix domain-containing protein n=1 Tax=Bartonella bovis m02 TaxID=1094492 RepID=N6VPD0_9HYPH|nr:hypothetical protein [Bartonella bovis]ENN92917.1 hypothetical protein m02_10090 [Bartonella bovis m02]
MGSGKGTGVVMGGTGTLMLNSVDISNVGGSGTGKYGVQMTGEGTMVMNMVGISGFEKGVSASNGTVMLNGGSAIMVKSGGTGLEVKDTANAILMGTTIKVKGSGSKGMQMGSSKTLKMMKEVRISDVTTGVQVRKGILAVKGGEIEFTRDHGIYLDKGGVAFLGEVNF